MTWKRCVSSLSNTAYVVLFTIGTLSYVNRENYWMAAVMLFFAFVGPLLYDDCPARQAVHEVSETDTKLGESSGVA